MYISSTRFRTILNCSAKDVFLVSEIIIKKCCSVLKKLLAIFATATNRPKLAIFLSDSNHIFKWSSWSMWIMIWQFDWKFWCIYDTSVSPYTWLNTKLPVPRSKYLTIYDGKWRSKESSNETQTNRTNTEQPRHCTVARKNQDCYVHFKQ